MHNRMHTLGFVTEYFGPDLKHHYLQTFKPSLVMEQLTGCFAKQDTAYQLISKRHLFLNTECIPSQQLKIMCLNSKTGH